MDSRIQAQTIITVLFVAFSVVYYEIVIGLVASKRPSLIRLIEIRDLIKADTIDYVIIKHIAESDALLAAFGNSVQSLYDGFSVVFVLCILNLSFLLQHIVTFIYTKRLGRFYEFPSILHFTDLLLFIASLIMISWVNDSIRDELYSDPNITEEDKRLRLVHNLMNTIDFKFQYILSIMIAMLVIRVAVMLQFNANIGPLIKIVGKMMTDFQNFAILYMMFTLMFAIIGNINFKYYCTEYVSFFDSIFTVIDASLGNYDFHIFDTIKDDDTLLLLGQVFTICIVIVFNILLLNLIIAILANTYNIFDSRSNGLFLSKILNTRDEMNYDENYGAFFSSMPPMNLVQIPFVPISLMLPLRHPTLLFINNFLM